MTYQFDYHSRRAAKARFPHKLGKHTVQVGAAVSTVLIIAAIGLIVTGNHIGLSLLGLSIPLVMALIWIHWDIHNSEVTQKALQSNTQLDQMLEYGLLSRMPQNPDANAIVLAASSTWEGMFVLNRLGLPRTILIEQLETIELSAESIWEIATKRRASLGASELDGGVIVAAVLGDVPGFNDLLSRAKLKNGDVASVAMWLGRYKAIRYSLQHRPYFGGIGRNWAVGYTPILDQLASNVTSEIEYGEYRAIPNIHQSLIGEVLTLVGQNRSSVLVGGIGSGRTSIMYAVAQRILVEDNVGSLIHHQVLSLNVTVLLSTGEQIESLVLQLFNEAIRAKNTIIFLDEAQVFFTDGPGSLDLSNILLPILQHSGIKIVLAMSDHDWQQLTTRQPALAATLQRLIVEEPSLGDVEAILQEEALVIEHTANSMVTQEAITEAIKLAQRYMPELSFPGKAISVLESASHYLDQNFITANSVRQAIEVTTGAKVMSASEPEKSELLNLEDRIHERMINQVRAVKVVCDALRRSRAGVGSPKRPVGSFLFLGPTGVGKTELAKALASTYYGGESAMIRLDMSEYQQSYDVSRLLSSASDAQAGGTLVSQIRRSPSSVILLDEIEKAHPDILNLLLQMLDEGSLTDSDGRPVSFKDAIIIATSNAAADDIRARIDAGQQLEEFEADITEGLIASHQFKPELLNRFDEIVLFRPLSKEELTQVVRLMLVGVNQTLLDQNVSVALTPAAIEWLVEHGYNPALGARPLRRVVQRSVENIVAERLLSGAVTAGGVVTLDLQDLEQVDVRGV